MVVNLLKLPNREYGAELISLTLALPQGERGLYFLGSFVSE